MLSMMKHRSLLLGLVILLTAVLAACSSGDDEAGSGANEVTITAENGTLSVTVPSSGSVTLTNKEDLKFGLQGAVSEVFVEAGDTVQAGDLLMKLDDAGFQAALSQARANAATAQQNLDKLLSPTALEVAKAEAALAVAQETLDNMVANNAATTLAQSRAEENASTALESAKDAYAYKLRLYYAIDPAREDLIKTDEELQASYAPDPLLAFGLDLIPYYPNQTSKDAEVDGAWTAVINAQNALDTSLLNAQAATNLGKLAQQRVAIAQAEEDLVALTGSPDPVLVLQRQAALQTALLNIEDAETELMVASMVAPISGVVTAVNVSAGDSVNVSTVVVSVADPTALSITGQVDEIDIFQVQPGQQVRVSLNALARVEIPGVVEGVDLIGQNQGGIVSYGITITIDLPQRGPLAGITVREGMGVTTTIVVREKTNVLLVPTGAIQREGADRVVTVVLADGTRETRVIGLGMTDGSVVEITDGLQSGEEIVVPSASAARLAALQSFRATGGVGGPPARGQR